jgi:hypothetical protein
LIASSIDANNHVLPFAYGLVPIKCQEWWQWFLKHFGRANPQAVEGEYVFMLDREKGLPAALTSTFPNAVQSFCC